MTALDFLQLRLDQGMILCPGEHIIAEHDGVFSLTCTKDGNTEPWWLYRPTEDPYFPGDVSGPAGRAMDSHALKAAEDAVRALLPLARMTTSPAAAPPGAADPAGPLSPEPPAGSAVGPASGGG